MPASTPARARARAALALAAVAQAEGREPEDVRPLVVPRTVGTWADHPYCDSYANFTAGVSNTWQNIANARAQVTGYGIGIVLTQ